MAGWSCYLTENTVGIGWCLNSNSDLFFCISLQRYIDGAISDNLPFWKLKNTITVSPFSGESDICPRESPFYYHDIQYNNVSIHLNFNNMYRVASVFLPPEPEVR